MSRRLSLLVPALLLFLAAQTADAQQQPGDAPGQLRVFLECGPCDFDFVRTEVGYVDWMRDRADADVHVLWRSQATGGGGRAHELEFIGLRRHAGKADTVTYVAGRDGTQDITRRGLLQVLKVGLVRYLADTPAAQRLQIGMGGPPGGRPGGPGGPPGATPGSDPWDFWVFTVGGNTFLNGESSRSSTSISGNLRAERVTSTWKMNYSFNGSYNRQRFTYEVDTRDTTVVSLQRSTMLNGLVVRSVNGHVSAGAEVSAGMSTRENLRLFFHGGPAVEYNLFPYAESTRRQLVVRYGPGIVSQEYRDTTIFLRTDETRVVHSLRAGYATRQTWGNVNFSANGQQYFHDTDLFNLVFSGGTTLNLVRGLRLNLNGNYQMVRDQINLAKRRLTAEEVLLRQRQLKTSYFYFTSIGLSYRFGSGVQNVVNPRFTGTGGGGEFFIF